MAAAVLVVAALVVVVRARLTGAALRPGERVRFDVLPSDLFDPTVEEIDRYAAHLARTRRSVRKGTGKAAQAVRLRLDADGDSIRYRLEGHRRAASILSTAGYHDVDLHIATDPDTPTQTPPSPHPTDDGPAVASPSSHPTDDGPSVAPPSSDPRGPSVAPPSHDVRTTVATRHAGTAP